MFGRRNGLSRLINVWPPAMVLGAERKKGMKAIAERGLTVGGDDAGSKRVK